MAWISTNERLPTEIMNIDEKILEILHDFETFKLTDDEQGVYAKTTSYMPFIDRIKALTIHNVVGQRKQLVCDCSWIQVCEICAESKDIDLDDAN